MANNASRIPLAVCREEDTGLWVHDTPGMSRITWVSAEQLASLKAEFPGRKDLENLEQDTNGLYYLGE